MLNKQVFSLIVEPCIICTVLLLGLNGHTFTIASVKLLVGQVEEYEAHIGAQWLRIQHSMLTFKRMNKLE